jgi:hypothetical protein
MLNGSEKVGLIRSIAAICVGLACAPVLAQPSPTFRWLLVHPFTDELAASAAASALDGKEPYVHYKSKSIPPAWNAVVFATFASEATLEEKAPSLPPTVKAVMYDNESWEFTPADEQADPVTYEQRAIAFAHAHRLKIFLTPAFDLGPTAYAAAVAGAKGADMFNIQEQKDEFDLGTFRSTITSEMQALRAATPDIEILVGVSTNGRRHGIADARTIEAAIRALPSGVNGVWLNVPTSSKAACATCVRMYRPDIAEQVITDLSK